MPVRVSILLTAVAAAAFTLLVTVGSAVSLAYRNPQLHVAVETAAALISLVAAQLVWGRFRQSLELRDLLLTCALAVFAVANSLFSALPAIADAEPGRFQTWAPVAGRLFGLVLFAASAVASDRSLRHPTRDARRALLACALALAVLSLAVAAAGDALPAAIPPDLSPDSAGRPRIVGSATVLVSELASVLLFGVAAVGHGLRAERTGDELGRWLAIAATLAAFARVNYFLFPSLYSAYFYTGDVLRLGFFVALAIGGVVEMGRLRHVMAGAAVLEERRRIAHEIHDGVAQDLAFILQHGRRLARRPDAPAGLDALMTAAQRALDECRHAVASLTRVGDEPLSEALTLTALETAGREGAEVQTAIEREIHVPAATQEALLRVTREAIINAIRHGGAGTVRVELVDDDAVSLVVSDDGRGFDVAQAARAPGRLGLKSMEARINAVGGRLRIESAPERGTRVEVRLP